MLPAGSGRDTRWPSGWLDDMLPGEPAVLKTQGANARSMRLAAKLGFIEVERYEAWDAEQWLGLRVSPGRLA